MLPLLMMLELAFIQVYKGIQRHWACDAEE